MMRLIQAAGTLVQWLSWSGIAVVLFFMAAIAWFGYICFKIALEPPEDMC